MKMSRRILSLVLAAALLITCGITGLILPVSAAGDELFPNGDFEQGAVAPWTNFAADNTHWAIGDGYGVDGSKGLKWVGTEQGTITAKKPHTTYAQFDSAITITEPGTYRFSFSSTLTGTTGITVSLESLSDATFLNRATNLIASKSTADHKGEWVTYHADFVVTEETVAFAAEEGLSIKVGTGDVNTYIGNNLAFDNFSLKKWDESEGLVMDGDFDKSVDALCFTSTSASYKSWLDVEGESAIVAHPNGEAGNRVLKRISGFRYVGAATYLVKNQSYLVKFDYSGPDFQLVDGTGGKFRAAPSWNQATITVSGTEEGEWKTFVGICTPGASNVTRYTLGFKILTDPVYIDNFNIYNYDGPDELEFAQNAVEIEEGAANQKLKLNAKAYGFDILLPEDTTWESSNNSVATVADGKVTAVSLGQATITATSGDVTATCTVNVVPAAPKITIDEEVIGGAITVTTKDIAAGEAVTVKATPDDGYVMVPGSLKYTTAGGTEVKILNKASGSFGEGTGNEFAFEMPNEDVTVTAEFTQDAFKMDSIGTAVHYTEGQADGIRFLTRLNINGGLQDGVLYLDGKEVKEIGTLLKRGEANLEEMKSADPNEAGVWKTVNYTSETGAFKAVDYTEQYIDFATSMMTKNNGQYYTAVGYITFADGTTVYSNGVQADNITSAQTRM